MDRPPTEFEIAAAKRAVQRLAPLIEKLSPGDQERVSNIASALLVATDEETKILEGLMAKAGGNIDKLDEVDTAALGIIGRHQKGGE